MGNAAPSLCPSSSLEGISLQFTYTNNVSVCLHLSGLNNTSSWTAVNQTCQGFYTNAVGVSFPTDQAEYQPFSPLISDSFPSPAWALFVKHSFVFPGLISKNVFR